MWGWGQVAQALLPVGRGWANQGLVPLGVALATVLELLEASLRSKSIYDIEFHQSMRVPLRTASQPIAVAGHVDVKNFLSSPGLSDEVKNQSQALHGSQIV